MADQAINALPTKDTPESTDQLLLIGDAEEKIIDYDKLADAILNKLTSKKFEMDTGTQTIMEAIASLNGKTSSRDITELPSDTNTMYPLNVKKDIIIGETTLPNYSKGFYLAFNDAIFICIAPKQPQPELLIGYRSNNTWKALSIE